MSNYVKFLWTAYRAYQGDPQAAAEVFRTLIAKVKDIESRTTGS